MKRRMLALMIALCLCLGLLPMTALGAEDVAAPQWVVTEIVPCKYDYCGIFGKEGLATVELNGKRGFIDTQGKEVISLKYDNHVAYSACYFSEGLSPVALNGRWGYIDTTGREVIPCTLEYSVAHAFFDGLAEVEKNGKYGLIDRSGREIAPCKYDYIGDFCEGLARVRLEDGAWGYIDTKGKEVIPCSSKYDDVRDFKLGLAKVYNSVGTRLIWGVIDQTGREVIPCQYDSVNTYDFIDVNDINDSNAIPLITAEQYIDLNKYSIFDRTGKQIRTYDRVEGFSDGLAAVVLDGKWGYIDKNGQEVVSLKYDEAGYFDNGFAQVQMNGKWGYIDQAGKEIIPCVLEYAGVGAFYEGLASVVRLEPESKHGYIDKSGKEVIPCKYDACDDFGNNVAWVGIGEWPDTKYGAIDQTGREIVPCKYDDKGPFSEGFAAVGMKTGEPDEGGYIVYKWGMIDTTGQEIIPCKYDYIATDKGECIEFYEGLVEVGIGGFFELKRGLVDKTGREVVPCQYDVLYIAGNGLVKVVMDGKEGLINTVGQEIVPCVYDSLSFYNDNGLAVVQLDGKWGVISIGKAEAPEPEVTMLTKSMFTVDTSVETYTGKPITKNVYGLDGDTTLVEGVDYTVAYRNNINVGTAKLTITGMGDYTGTLTYSFTIKAKPSSGSSGGGGGSSSSGGSSSGGGGSSGGGSSTTTKPVETEKPTAPAFADVVKDSWYEAGVRFVADKGLFQGVAPNQFAPNINMTRAMLLTVLARLDGRDAGGGGTWYGGAVSWAVSQGISDGTMLDQSVTREQLVTILYRYAKAKVGTADLSAFADGAKVSDWAKDAMTWAVSQGILTGKDGQRLDPQGTATRAEVATILQRFVEKS